MLENEGPLEPNLLAKGFRAIDMQSEKLGRLASQLMDVSRVESGKLQLDRRDVDVSTLVRSLVMEVQAGTDRHVVQVRVSDCCIVSVDPLRLEQVVSNLLSNAVKYSPAGGPIDVTLQRIGRSAISLKVRDWGVGIPPERRAQLFDRFYQAHGEGHFGGLGLGLYISRQIVELHGGRIAVEFPPDEPAAGLPEVVLPLQPASARAAKPAPPAAAARRIERRE
jgi:signal transduction histidine kinase